MYVFHFNFLFRWLRVCSVGRIKSSSHINKYISLFYCWVGIMVGKILCAIIFDRQFTTVIYLLYLRNEINDFIENLPLAIESWYLFITGWIATSQLSCHINETFPEKQIGANGLIQCPAKVSVYQLTFFVDFYFEN